MKTTSSNQIYKYFHPTVLYAKLKYSCEKRRKEGREGEREGQLKKEGKKGGRTDGG